MNILYVEDNNNDAQLIHRYASAEGHAIAVVKTMVEARAAFRQSFDLVLMDVLLGQERGGIVLAQELRAQGFNGPIVAVTGLTTQRDIDACRQAGFDAVLAKPFEIAELDALVQSYT